MQSTQADPVRMRRELVDLIAEVRSRAVRVALFGTLIHRPDPQARDAAAERAANLRVLTDTARWIDRVRAILETGADPWGELPDDLCRWAAGFVPRHPGILDKMRGMAEMSDRVARAAAEAPEELGAALRAHYDFRRAGFMEAVTRFCDGIWAEMDAERIRAEQRAVETGNALTETLARLEMIGRHVRLVSLNASVEASRIGDAGKGIGVIAVEFKSLAEEIQNLASSAKSNLKNLAGKALGA